MIWQFLWSLLVARIAASKEPGAPTLAAGPALSNDIVAVVNRGASWRAHRNVHFEGWSAKQVQRLLGVTSSLDLGSASESVAIGKKPTNGTFDAQKAWPGCIGSIRDQGNCGSCWAVAAAEAMSDRMCISKFASGGSANFIRLSAMDLTSCDFKGENMGCLGGVPLPAWEYARQSGVVTDACMPYLKVDGGSIDTCTPQPNCSLDKHDATPYCSQMCVPGSSRQYDGDKHHLVSAYSVQSSAVSIAAEMQAHGPVEATFAVYQDFLHYASGVYRHVAGEFMGKHAVKLIGFGVDERSGLPYWLAANSWSTTWGDSGYFKIAKGSSECGIESEVTAGRFSANPSMAYLV